MLRPGVVVRQMMVKLMRSKVDIVAYVLIVLFVLFLIIYGWKVHVIETNGAEMDDYASRADEILAGKIPRDAYHPLLYPMLSASVGSFLKGGFAGARVISSLAAGLFLLAAYLLGRLCFDRVVSFFSLAALMLNCNVIITGVEAATDMTFAAFALLSLLFSIRISSGLSYVSLTWLALSLALAYFTRYSAVFLAPTVILALAFSLSRVDARRKILGLAVFAGTLVLFLIPHFMLTMKAFHSPFHNESWKIVAYNMYGNGDYSYYWRVPYHGLISVIASSPSRLFLLFLRELVRFFHVTLGTLGGQGLAGGLFTAFALLGGYFSLFALDRKRILLIAFAGCCVLFSSLFNVSLPRYMLPILPLCYLWAGSFIFSGFLAETFQIGKITMRRSIPVVAVFMLALLASTLVSMRHYANAHPVGELKAARFIEERYGSNVTVLGTFRYMQRYVGYRYHQLEDAQGEEITRPDLYWDKLKTAIETNRADYVIIGRLFLHSRPAALLAGEQVPDFLDPILRNPDVVVYRVRQTEGKNE